jgi:hypothetical protein
MTKRKIETANSLLGIRSQLRAAINLNKKGFPIILTLKQAKRIEEALRQFERNERILTEPFNDQA